MSPEGEDADAVLRTCAESATGIREGGRTGLVGITVAFWMFIALWFTPIIGEHASLALPWSFAIKLDLVLLQLPK